MVRLHSIDMAIRQVLFNMREFRENGKKCLLRMNIVLVNCLFSCDFLGKLPKTCKADVSSYLRAFLEREHAKILWACLFFVCLICAQLLSGQRAALLYTVVAPPMSDTKVVARYKRMMGDGKMYKVSPKNKIYQGKVVQSTYYINSYLLYQIVWIYSDKISVMHNVNYQSVWRKYGV